ncbi:MAG: hypothetical protein ABI612_02965 [Betaproteobacteria bacterium]
MFGPALIEQTCESLGELAGYFTARRAEVPAKLLNQPNRASWSNGHSKRATTKPPLALTNNPTTTIEIIITPPRELLLALFVPTPKAQKRFIEFFTAQISNDNTRRAHHKATPLGHEHAFDWLVTGT